MHYLSKFELPMPDSSLRKLYIVLFAFQSNPILALPILPVRVFKGVHILTCVVFLHLFSSHPKIYVFQLEV